MTGTRPHLMLLPGLLCDASSFTAARAELESVADVQVPNFFGFDSILSMAEHVLEQAPAKFSIAGFSMGGRVAFQVARLAPERIERFCVFDTGAPPAGPDEPAKRQILVDLAYNEGMRAVADSWLPPMLHPDRRADEAFKAPLVETICSVTPEIFEKQIRALLGRPDARPVLPTIHVPSLVLVGAQDEWSPIAVTKAIADAIPNCRFEVVEGAGHFLPTEKPQEFARILKEWLAVKV